MQTSHEPTDYRPPDRRVLLLIASDAFQEALGLFSVALHKLLHISACILLTILLLFLQFGMLVLPYYTPEISWIGSNVPGLIVLLILSITLWYIIRSLFSLSLNMMHSFAVKIRGRA